MPMLKAAKELEYGFMILDKTDPSSMFKPAPQKVFVIPPEEETRMPAQQMAEGFQSAANKVKGVFSADLQTEARDVIRNSKEPVLHNSALIT